MQPGNVDLVKKARQLRHEVLEMCIKAGTGHVTSSFSCTEIITALYYGGILRYDVKNPKWEDRDRFILSKAQASPILYCTLADLGFFPKHQTEDFCCSNGMFGVHLQNDVPGVETTGGSLGQGLGIAAGIALAAKMDRKLHMTFVLMGDGECYEGSIWESAMFASHNRLNNLIAIIDRNWLSTIDFTENALKLNPMDKKWESFGWEVININGHEFSQIFGALHNYRTRQSCRPLMIIAETVKGKGVSFFENVPLWHALAPQGVDAENARIELINQEIK